MNFLNGITNLTNWMGNVIMPTVAGLFFALAVVRYARGYPHQYIAWSGSDVPDGFRIAARPRNVRLAIGLEQSGHRFGSHSAGW